MMLQATDEMSGFRLSILCGWSSVGRLRSPSSLDIPHKRPILSRMYIAGKVASACRSRAQFIVLERWPRDVGRIETPVVSAASDETYLRPNDYCQLAPARRDGAACRAARPPTPVASRCPWRGGWRARAGRASNLLCLESCLRHG